MKTYIAILLFATLTCGETTKPVVLNNCSKITLYVINDKYREGQVSEWGFWHYTEGLDTIEIRGRNLTKLYIEKFSTLKDTMLFRPGEIDQFNHKFAFVFSNNSIVDTVYGDLALKFFQWKNRGKKYYKDETGFFSEHFEKFSLY